MNVTLKELKDTVSDSGKCVTLILNTHRTSPDNKKDSLVLKNLIKDAEERLIGLEGEKKAEHLVQRMRDLEAEIDHNFNLESLILFVNENIAKYVRLPVAVEDRAVISYTFATRELVRAMHQETNYYVLLLSQQKSRLIEVFNDKVISEAADPFPIENTELYATSRDESANANRQRNLLAEYFNRVDKAVNEARKQNPAPVLICTEESNYHEYLKIADQKQTIFETYLNRNRLDDKAHHVATEAWKVVKEYNEKQNNARKSELEKAVSTGNFLSDVNDIRRALLEGRIQTLFIEQGAFQPGIMADDHIELIKIHDERNRQEIVEDVYDELIEMNLDFGGNTVFLPKGELTDFNGFGAITRY